MPNKSLLLVSGLQFYGDEAISYACSSRGRDYKPYSVSVTMNELGVVTSEPLFLFQKESNESDANLELLYILGIFN